MLQKMYLPRSIFGFHEIQTPPPSTQQWLSFQIPLSMSQHYPFPPRSDITHLLPGSKPLVCIKDHKATEVMTPTSLTIMRNDHTGGGSKCNSLRTQSGHWGQQLNGGGLQWPFKKATFLSKKVNTEHQLSYRSLIDGKCCPDLKCWKSRPHIQILSSVGVNRN